MTLRVGINGFGRIGRLVLRAALERNDPSVAFVAINDLTPADSNLHLLNFDSVHGRLATPATLAGDVLKAGSHSIKIVQHSSPAQTPWGALGVDVVLECSGRFTKRSEAQAHIDAGAKKVLISAPATDEDFTVVYGVNHKDLKATHTVISNGSCTTNCLTPVAVTLHKAFGIEQGFMTTVHSYTADQRLVDGAHSDPHRARAAALNMIPTSTGAAKAVFKVLPELTGKLDGTAIRVPTANVSMIDFKFTAGRKTSVAEVNAALKAAAAGPLAGVLAVTDLPLVSGDFNHDPHSATVALGETKVIDGTFVRVLAWYDNEWGFSNRMLDVLPLLA